MIRPPHRAAHQGFTLIEVIVAMAVIALGVGALLSTLNTSAGMVINLRDRSFAEWIALNRIAETRLATTAPGVGVTTGEVTDYAKGKWLWRQEVVDPDVAGMLRLNVYVARSSDKATKALESGEDFPSMARAVGFMGTDMGTANGLDPSWTQTAPRTTGSLNPGGIVPAGAP